ncbi:MAG: (2E,6E)-farnesyl diphosphate synthase [Oceanospirillaceae bacterium]|nr:(2E,6E)-farnesyl diphosphate synthase [Oceanospirillaceae bacterium]
MHSFNEYLASCQQRIDQQLTQAVTFPDNGATRLHQAMAYSLFNGGKRVRPLLVYAAAHAMGCEQAVADAPAMAVELIHAYSLVHDDLPAMDDDDLRRGKPTCHIAFDEATAILAGDALQAEAFQVLIRAQGLTPAQKIQLLDFLAQGSGALGMAAGQAIDLAAVGQTVDLAYLENMHNHKTGALIKASVLMGACCNAQVSSAQLEALGRYATAIGLAFQVQDDILDVTADTATLGKTQGADAAHNKPTYVSLLGLDGARAKASELHQQALAALQDFDEGAIWLRALADYIIQRAY